MIDFSSVSIDMSIARIYIIFRNACSNLTTIHITSTFNRASLVGIWKYKKRGRRLKEWLPDPASDFRGFWYIILFVPHARQNPRW